MKRLSALLDDGKLFSECRIPVSYDPMIEQLELDSRKIGPRSVFFAINGLHVDGHRYIDEAIAHGAVAVIHEKPLVSYRPDIAYCRAGHVRMALSHMAARLHGDPQTGLSIIGVTGTDGKTTTCEFLWQLLKARGIACALLDTVSIDDGSGRTMSPYRQSTPEPTELYRFLSRCRDNGVTHVVLEATSHGLSNEHARLSGIHFSVAVYTTITSEHLEFHKSKERYIDAKLNLARQLLPGGHVCFPANFPYKAELMQALPEGITTLTYALDDPNLKAVLHARTHEAALASRWGTVSDATGSCSIRFGYGPALFMRNMLGSLLAASAVLGCKPLELAPSVELIKQVEGRFCIIPNNLSILTIVDFAHTADAFEQLFSEVEKLYPASRIVAVFGAAGERDRSKRAPMGAIAAKHCCSIVLTDEDPRNEDPSGINADIKSGIACKAAVAVHEIADRRSALAFALRLCRPGDVLLALGKGHEHTIQYPAGPLAWDEATELKQQLTILEVERQQGGTS